MEASEILLPLLVAIVTASWGTTQARLMRIERQLATKPSREEFEALRADVATKPSREEFNALRAEVAAKPGREEFNSLRVEVTGLRTEVTAMRADLTQIALALGAGRPQATEG